MYIRNMKRTLTTFSTFALFAGAALAADPEFIGGGRTTEDVSSVENTLSSGTYGNVAGGTGGVQNGSINSNGAVNGDVLLNLENVNITGWIIGGNTANSSFDAQGNDYLKGVSGKITVNFNEGTVLDNTEKSANVAGLRGGLSGAQTHATVGSIELNLNGGEMKNSFVMAAGGNGSANILGDVVVNANGTNIYGRSYTTATGKVAIMGVQGSYDPTDAKYGYGADDRGDSMSSYLGGRIKGALRINVSGGEINGNIWGAYADSRIDGGTHILLSGGVVNGDVNLGVAEYNAYIGASDVTLVNDAVVNGTIYGKMKADSRAKERYMESATLNIGTAENAYVGTGALKVSDFDRINVAKGTNAVIESLSFTQSGAVACGVKIADGGALVVNGDVVRNYNNVTNVAGSDSLVAGLDGGDAVVKGTVRTVIDGADTNIKKFYGGNGGNQKTGEYVYNGEVKTGPVPKGTSTVGAVDITVNNGTISDFILASGAMHSDVAGNVDVKINGGNISEITGGACGANVGGDVNIVVNGGKIGKIEAGGCGSGENIREDGIVGGSTNVILGGNSVITGDVYGGGWSDGEKWRDTVKGSTNITLKDSVSVGGNLYGGSMGGTGTIVGSKNLFVGTTESAYVGSSALKVADFQKIDIVNGSANFASFTQAAEGTLVSISDKGKLSMSLNSASQLSDTSFENAGELVFKRGLLSDSDSVALKSYTGSGNVSAYGGTFADGVFTAGKSAAFDSSAITVGTGVNDVQSVKLADKLALDFNVAGLGEAAITVNEVRESTDTTGIDGKVLAAFDVNVSDNDNNYTVVFSAYVGALEDAGVLTAWHKGSDGVWTQLDTAIDYANEIASITVDGFSSYAFAAAVPEPATIAAILGAVALSFAVFRRRK